MEPVADNTREGEVFLRLLAKIEEQRKAYGGKVFDVLGTAFGETPLRTLLIDAIRYGERPRPGEDGEGHRRQRRARDRRAACRARARHRHAAARGHRAAARTHGRGARTAPAAALHRGRVPGGVHALGGKIRRRERGRFEITHVPAQLRTAGRGPIATRYDRVTFDIEHVLDDTGARAELLAPGHPLHDAVTDETVARWHRTLERGTVLVSPSRGAPARRRHRGDRRCDGDRRSRAASATPTSTSTAPWRPPPAPYLDRRGAADDEVVAARGLPWLAQAEERAASWIIANQPRRS